jgi:hypothetical protein
MLRDGADMPPDIPKLSSAQFSPLPQAAPKIQPMKHLRSLIRRFLLWLDYEAG